MGCIRVIYRTKRYDYDYVSSGVLDTLIRQDEISHFYRPSEKRWVNVRFDLVRGRGGWYQGPERRRNEKSKLVRKIPVSAFQGTSVPWLERLWRSIED